MPRNKTKTKEEFWIGNLNPDEWYPIKCQPSTVQVYRDAGYQMRGPFSDFHECIEAATAATPSRNSKLQEAA